MDMKQRVLVRFANESNYINTIELDPTRLTNVIKFTEEVFATIDGIRIAIKRVDFDSFNLENTK
jgi:hypothetical protein